MAKSRDSDKKRLADYERAYARLAGGLSRSGFLWTGTVLRYAQECGKPACRCHTGRQFRHGPYYVWTRKIKGKTVTRILSDDQGMLYTTWIQNRRKLDRTIKKILKISERIAPILLRRMRQS